MPVHMPIDRVASIALSLTASRIACPEFIEGSVFMVMSFMVVAFY
jgi:hypothetical protein